MESVKLIKEGQTYVHYLSDGRKVQAIDLGGGSRSWWYSRAPFMHQSLHILK